MSVSLLAAEGVEVLRYVPANLQRLFVAGIISGDAYFLGLQSIAKMEWERRLQTTLTLREATSRLTTINGTLRGGALDLSDPLNGIGALQQLHTHAGILNHFQEQGLNTPDPHYAHFSVSPFVTFGVDWTVDTPIVFRFDSGNMLDWTAHAREAASKATSAHVVIDIRV